MNKIIYFIIWPTVAGLLFALALLQLPRLAGWFPDLVAYPPNIQTSQEPEKLSTTFSTAIKKAAPAVVRISSLQKIVRFIDGGETPESPSSLEYQDILAKSNNLGSGVIISPDGYIITSYHIFFSPENTLGYEQSSTITFNNGRSVEARPVAVDKTNDLVLFKVDIEDLPFITPAPQNNIQVGDIVLAIGNPRNIGQSVSMGIISALLKNDDSYVIQTDAAINPGNSGGALIDSNGNLIGINSTIISESGGSEGIGFATPADKAISLLNSYLTSNPGGYLGILDAQLSPFYISNLGTQAKGILVNVVAKNSPAEKAGIRAGDIITGSNRQRFILRNDNDFIAASNLISNYGAGKSILIEILRDSTFIEIPVTLGVGEIRTFMDIREKKTSEN